MHLYFIEKRMISNIMRTKGDNLEYKYYLCLVQYCKAYYISGVDISISETILTKCGGDLEAKKEVQHFASPDYPR